ncbi:MAG: hypothetical protein AB200_01060 [Parcubacteria bacterium C7867-005]|nr:MAG: hypothetical protein AB200_01060 [Parcubacteria bacterium C7867-005]
MSESLENYLDAPLADIDPSVPAFTYEAKDIEKFLKEGKTYAEIEEMQRVANENILAGKYRTEKKRAA